MEPFNGTEFFGTPTQSNPIFCLVYNFLIGFPPVLDYPTGDPCVSTSIPYGFPNFQAGLFSVVRNSFCTDFRFRRYGFLPFSPSGFPFLHLCTPGKVLLLAPLSILPSGARDLLDLYPSLFCRYRCLLPAFDGSSVLGANTRFAFFFRHFSDDSNHQI